MILVIEDKEKGKNEELIIDLENEIHDDPYMDGSSNHDWQNIYENMLNDISIDEVWKLKFNCID